MEDDHGLDHDDYLMFYAAFSDQLAELKRIAKALERQADAMELSAMCAYRPYPIEATEAMSDLFDKIGERHLDSGGGQ